MTSKSKKLTAEKSYGRFYTPDYIVNNILDLAGYCESNIIKKHVIDNSCGDGAFLTIIVNRYCKERIKNETDISIISKELETFIHGIELDETEWKKSISNLNEVIAAYGIYDVKWDVICADAMTVSQYNGKMDFVLGNPPYIRVHNLGDSLRRLKIFHTLKMV